MADTATEEVNPIEAVLEKEIDAENNTEIKNSGDHEGILAKAGDKVAMMNTPTERKNAEEVAKMASQISSAEQQKDFKSTVTPGTVNPNNQTFGVLGVPLAAAVHDFDLDRAARDQASVKDKIASDSKDVKEHNETLTRIVSNIEKENDKK